MTRKIHDKMGWEMIKLLERRVVKIKKCLNVIGQEKIAGSVKKDSSILIRSKINSDKKRQRNIDLEKVDQNKK